MKNTNKLQRTNNGEQPTRKRKKKFIILTLLTLSLASLFALLYYNYERDDQVYFEEKEKEVIENTKEEEMNDIAEKEHSLKLSIISPEEETFIPRQARMYNSLLEGNQKYDFANVRCNWKFYINENNEETLLKEMNNTSIMSGESKELCGFTSTFIDRVGVLRVVLNITLYNAMGDLESVQAERTYTVTK